MGSTEDGKYHEWNACSCSLAAIWRWRRRREVPVKIWIHHELYSSEVLFRVQTRFLRLRSTPSIRFDTKCLIKSWRDDSEQTTAPSNGSYIPTCPNSQLPWFRLCSCSFGDQCIQCCQLCHLYLRDMDLRIVLRSWRKRCPLERQCW